MGILEELKQAYAEAKKEYPKLPDYEMLNTAFDLEDHFRERKYLSRYLLRNIRRRIADYLFGWVNLIHNVLVPMPNSMILTQEYQELSDEDKQKLTVLIQKIMLQTRASLQLELEKNDPKDAEYITKAYTMYQALQPELKTFTDQLTKCWEKPPQPPAPPY